MSDVFVSYAHADAEQVADLVAKLEQARLNVWWDKNLPDGRTWDDQVEEALARAATILVVWSQNSVRSENVKDEAGYALDERKPLSVRIENVTPPLRWRRIQYRNLFERPIDVNADWPKVVEAIRAHHPAGRVGDEATIVGRGSATPVTVKDGVAFPPGIVAPALLVTLSLISSLVNGLAPLPAPGTRPWAVIISAGFGICALIWTLGRFVPRSARSAT